MSRLIGLTGQSGAGKTLVSQIFVKRGFGLINCDEVARIVTEPRKECTLELYHAFPGCVSEDYVLDRKKLGDLVFGDKAQLEKLNEIIFRYIHNKTKAMIADMAFEYGYIVIDAPTLFEANMAKNCDIIISVLADEDTRRKRIMERDGLDEERANNRFASQHSAEFFEENSQYVIYNNGSVDDVIEQTMDIIDKILKER